MLTVLLRLEHSYGARSRMIPNSSAQEAEKWLLDHPSVVCHADAMLACSATVGFIFLTISTHMKTAADDALHRMVLHNMQNDFEQWKERWLGDHRALDYFMRPLILSMLTTNSFSSSRKATSDLQSHRGLLWCMPGFRHFSFQASMFREISSRVAAYP
jgi:hypothetical protein